MTWRRAAAALLVALPAAPALSVPGALDALGALSVLGALGGCAMLRPDKPANGAPPDDGSLAAASAPGGAASAPLSAAASAALASVATSASAAAATATAAPATATPFTLVTPQEFEQQSPTLGVRVQIDAPRDLKTLLEKNLDVLRLGALTRDDVEDGEWARLIDATPAQVRELLQTEGYFTPQVDLGRTPRRAANQPDIVTLQVQPGPRAHVGRVTLEVEGDLARAADNGAPDAVAALQRWRAAWALQNGRDFRNAAWSDAKAAALSRLRGAGYANAAWVGTGAQVDPLTQQVRLFLVADSGALFRYGELQIEGLARHDTQTVANLLNAQRGVPVTETLLLDFQDRLQKAGLFENVSVTLDTDASRAERARIVVRLSEAPVQVATVGLGISANTGPRASLEHTYRRVFGYAASSRNKFEYGQKRQAWEGELSTHPGVGLYRNLLGGAVENLLSDTDTVLSQRLRVGRTQDTQRIERLTYVETERSRRTTTTEQRSSAFALSLNYHGVWRELDNVILPTRGFSFSGQVGIGRSHGTDADSGVFTRAYGRFTGYLPLGDTWYGQARLELGKVFLGPNMVVTESQKFRAGGDDSVRGYGYRSLGPLVDGVVGSGNALFTSSVELARPILAAMPSLWGAVFVDAGNAADSVKDLKPVVGVGVGVRWRSPVGPLRVDYAFSPNTNKSRLHFSVGIAF